MANHSISLRWRVSYWETICQLSCQLAVSYVSYTESVMVVTFVTCAASQLLHKYIYSPSCIVLVLSISDSITFITNSLSLSLSLSLSFCFSITFSDTSHGIRAQLIHGDPNHTTFRYHGSNEHTNLHSQNLHRPCILQA